MATDFTTADLIDEHGDTLRSCATQFRGYGGRAFFAGPIRTVKCHEDNGLVKQVLNTPGEGAVLVVDGGGSLRSALMGDMIAEAAVTNGWSGVVINGAVRDTAALGELDLGVKALGSNPRKSLKDAAGAWTCPSPSVRSPSSRENGSTATTTASWSTPRVFEPCTPVAPCSVQSGNSSLVSERMSRTAIGSGRTTCPSSARGLRTQVTRPPGDSADGAPRTELSRQCQRSPGISSTVSGTQSNRQDHHSSSSTDERVATKNKYRSSTEATGPAGRPARPIRVRAITPAARGTSKTSKTRPVGRTTLAWGSAAHQRRIVPASVLASTPHAAVTG